MSQDLRVRHRHTQKHGRNADFFTGFLCVELESVACLNSLVFGLEGCFPLIRYVSVALLSC